MASTRTNDLTEIPGIGPKIAARLESVGITSVAKLRRSSPDAIYRRLCDHSASPVDRCVLYVLRCADYYASKSDPDPALLKWWNWKDRS